MKLSEKQKEIVEYGPGAVLVKAGPGSGKTRVVIERIKYLLHKKKNINILALTFSNMAADEMKDRIEEDIEIVDYISNVTVETLHSFCMEMIQKRYQLLGFDSEPIIFESDKDKKKILIDIFMNNPLFMSALKKSANNSNLNIDKKIDQYISYISDLKREFKYPEMYEDNQLFKRIYKEYCDTLIAQNAMDFDDILYYAYKLLSENSFVSKTYNQIYKYYFVDEAQDLNYAQYMVLKSLCCPEIKPNIMMVGDENQSIYAFNGSDSRIMCSSFVVDYSPHIFLLYENFRSAKSIVRFANKLEATDSETSFYFEGEMNFYALEDEYEEATWICKNIKELMNSEREDIDHKLKYSDFGIIARNRYSLDKIAKKLEEEHIPYYFKKNNSGLILDSKMMIAFDNCIRLLINSKDIIHKKQLCSVVGKEYDAEKSINDILSDTKFSVLISYLDKITLDYFDFGKLLKCMREDFAKYTDLLEAELVIDDIDLYMKHWKKYIQIFDRDDRNLASFRTAISLGKTASDNNISGISLLTVHMSKGLQYDVVYVVGCSDGSFPDFRSINDPNDLQQEKNNMFVAVTRAKRICNVTYPIRKTMPWGNEKIQSPSRFIKTETIIKL